MYKPGRGKTLIYAKNQGHVETEDLEKKAGPRFSAALLLQSCGRGERIRTSDSYVPNVVLYQAELRPDRGNDGARRT
jgi:hypothetical protein